MKKLVVCLSVAVLAACSQPDAPAEEAPAAVETPSAAVTPGFYETMNSEGTLGGAQLMEDGSYRLFGRDGNDTGNGTWTSVGKRSCFDPAGDDSPEICYTSSEPDESGRFDATSESGDLRITVRPIGGPEEIGSQP
ncbi:hypothetical protein [Erythrobacter litoralis]|uniref:Secreted protein n=1 Tax=Erythrobacter litoralis (strain HTCC2594) TaxID=314225 RepID=Q2NA57_ERYLH|nr:hypothetical protein [Erythrobacter litoralis]ABC63434.1 hypothetical protein ELI_06710 [Erythrobacter litoralis HTCC2594]